MRVENWKEKNGQTNKRTDGKFGNRKNAIICVWIFGKTNHRGNTTDRKRRKKNQQNGNGIFFRVCGFVKTEFADRSPPFENNQKFARNNLATIFFCRFFFVQKFWREFCVVTENQSKKKIEKNCANFFF